MRTPFQNALIIVNPVSGQSRGRPVSRRVQADLLAKGVVLLLIDIGFQLLHFRFVAQPLLG